MPFDPDYVRLVLTENFDDAKAAFLQPLLDIHYAHLVMLTERGIVPVDAARTIRKALDGIDVDAVRHSTYDGCDEDLFFHVERLLAAACGPEIAGRLHTARSRNDIDMTLYRLRIRTFLLDVIGAALDARDVLIALAARHLDTVFAAHTHTQPAQPTTIAHYLLAAVEQLGRDHARLTAALATVNQNPLGACAITGTGFPIDRQRTSDLLGFDRPTENTYGSIASADYLLESVAAAQVALVGIGRLIQDLLLWCTSEFGYLRLPDGFVQSSSVMPQKRNPVALEHARALASKALGQAVAVTVAVHNTPYGDIVDTEDDLQPLVALMFRDAARAIELVAASMRHAEFDVVKMRERAGAGWITVTELADTLAREYQIPFRIAHSIASRVVRSTPSGSTQGLSGVVSDATRELAGRAIALSDDQLARILSPEHFVAVRKTRGGPAREAIEPALADARAKLASDRSAATNARDRLARARDELKSAVERL
jgi:argininosuccinate lyase